jgi:hypothetical protein
VHVDLRAAHDLERDPRDRQRRAHVGEPQLDLRRLRRHVPAHVRRGGDRRDARAHVQLRHRERAAEVGRAVVDPRQQVAVQVDHAAPDDRARGGAAPSGAP